MVADQRDSIPSLGLNEGILRREVTNHVQTPKPTPPEGILEFGDRNAARSGLPGHVDASHWSSIMETIRAIRDDLPDASPQERLETDTESFTAVELSESDNIDFALSLSGRANIDNILSQLPPRQVCDTLVSLFFRSHYAMLRKSLLYSRDMRSLIRDGAAILHPTKFQQEVCSTIDTYLSCLTIISHSMRPSGTRPETIQPYGSPCFSPFSVCRRLYTKPQVWLATLLSRYHLVMDYPRGQRNAFSSVTTSRPRNMTLRPFFCTLSVAGFAPKLPIPNCGSSWVRWYNSRYAKATIAIIPKYPVREFHHLMVR